MARGGQAHAAASADELDQFKRLVELQGQIVEQARKNELAEKECETLWKRLAREARRKPHMLSPLKPEPGAIHPHHPNPPRRIPRILHQLLRRASDRIQSLSPSRKLRPKPGN